MMIESNGNDNCEALTMDALKACSLENLIFLHNCATIPYIICFLFHNKPISKVIRDVKYVAEVE